MADFYALALATALTAAAVLVHFEALRGLSAWHERFLATGHAKILFIIFGLIAAHILEAAIFASGYRAGERVFSLGSFASSRPMEVLNFFYFSLETFTTQGVGDVYPTGPLRLVASLELLVGLILIGWSVSLTFLLMGRDWPLGAPCAPSVTTTSRTAPPIKFASV